MQLAENEVVQQLRLYPACLDMNDLLLLRNA